MLCIFGKHVLLVQIQSSVKMKVLVFRPLPMLIQIQLFSLFTNQERIVKIIKYTTFDTTFCEARGSDMCRQDKSLVVITEVMF